MADQVLTDKGKSASGATPHGFQGAARAGKADLKIGDMKTEARAVAGQAASAAEDIKGKAGEAASVSADTITEQAAEFVDGVKEFGAKTADRMKDAVADQKQAGADYVSSIAEAMRRAAQEFDQDLPIAGTYMRKAATQVDAAADTVKSGDINDLLHSVRGFARERPAAFIGLAALAGFGVVRFLKSSAEDTSGDATRRDRA